MKQKRRRKRAPSGAGPDWTGAAPAEADSGAGLAAPGRPERSWSEMGKTVRVSCERHHYCTG